MTRNKESPQYRKSKQPRCTNHSGSEIQCKYQKQVTTMPARSGQAAEESISLCEAMLFTNEGGSYWEALCGFRGGEQRVGMSYSRPGPSKTGERLPKPMTRLGRPTGAQQGDADR